MKVLYLTNKALIGTFSTEFLLQEKMKEEEMMAEEDFGDTKIARFRWIHLSAPYCFNIPKILGLLAGIFLRNLGQVIMPSCLHLYLYLSFLFLPSPSLCQLWRSTVRRRNTLPNCCLLARLVWFGWAKIQINLIDK